MQSTPRLVTPRLLLRPFEDSDFQAVRAYRGDHQVMRYITGPPETDEEIADFLQRAQSHAQQNPRAQYRFALVHSVDRRIIGGCGLDITHQDWREGEIGYHLSTDFWGQGLATETTIALLRFGFDDLGLHRIIAECLEENTASARVMQKAGMRQEGHFLQSKCIGERWHDSFRYALLDWEWKGLDHPDN